MYDASLIHPTRADEEINKIDGGIVFYGGGGNLVHYYYVADTIISQVLKRCDKLVILPHTIQGHYRLLHHLPDKVEIPSQFFTEQLLEEYGGIRIFNEG